MSVHVLDITNGYAEDSNDSSSGAMPSREWDDVPTRDMSIPEDEPELATVVSDVDTLERRLADIIGYVDIEVILNDENEGEKRPN